MSCADKPELIVRECATGSIQLPHEVLKDASKDIFVETNPSVLTMHVEDIIKHLRNTYLEEKEPLATHQ